MFDGKTILITGGTGSFGNAVVQRYLKTDIAEIRIFSRDEKKQSDMRGEIKDKRVQFFLGDVRDEASLQAPMQSVDYVFHAAAYKQVPSCEFFPLEAIKTNILGSENVLNAAAENGVKKVVVLSTDKSVYPICAMGMTKAMMEKLMVAKARLNQSKTVFCGTRYGNVVASRGSVVPLFINQILAGKPLTITDPNMARFMMDIDEAIDLVVHAFEKGQPGDVFAQKAPAATILTVVEALKEVFGADNPIQVIGNRHGEKLSETLVAREEMLRATECDSYFRIPMEERSLNYEAYFSEGQKKPSVEEFTSLNTRQLNQAEMVALLRRLDYIKDALRGR
jgi:UDP-N-acetylglucosamine 4,6-dehydratase/5-epimerase